MKQAKLSGLALIAALLTSFLLAGCVGEVPPLNSAVVLFSRQGGFYQDEFALKLTTTSDNAEIYYTLNGSEPSPENGLLYTEPLVIKPRLNEPPELATIQTTHFDWLEPGEVFKATVVRARAYVAGLAVGETQTNTYFVDKDIYERYQGLAVISLSTDPVGFFSSETGIYVPGDIWQGPTANLWADANYRQRGDDWERPAYMEFYEPEGRLGFAQQVGVRVHGNITRSLAQKSLRIYARNSYGSRVIDYDVFPGSPHQEFRRLILRNSGDDWNYTLFRDGMIQSLFSGTNVDGQAFRPAVVFINGEFWGIHNIRERLDRHYLETHHNIDPDNVDILWNNMLVSDGDDREFKRFFSFIEQNDLSVAANYAQVLSMMDVDSFIDHQIAHIYTGNRDSMTNNLSYWRERTPEGKWRWFLFDLDWGFYFTDHNTLEWALDPELRDRPWSTLIFRRLSDNESFRWKFINRYADLLNSNLLPENVVAQIEQMAEDIRHVVPEHLERWGHPFDMGLWNRRVDVMKAFANERPAHAREHIINAFDLEGVVTVKVEIQGEGVVQLNSLTLSSEESVWTGVYFQEVPLQLKAVPKEGYEFVGWSYGASVGEVELEVLPLQDVHIIARFRKV